MDGTGVFLWNLVNGEVRDIDVRAESWLEWSTDVAKLLPDHSAEEGVVFNLRGTAILATFATNTVFRVTQETDNPLATAHILKVFTPHSHIPSDEMLGFTRESKFLREVKTLPPVHNLTVGVGSVLSAEWWPSNETLEHNGTNRPPVTQVGVPLAVEDFGSNVVWCSDGRVRHGTARLSPGVDLSTVRHGQVDCIVEVPRVAVLVLGRRVLEQVLVVRVVVRLLATGGKTEIR